MTTANYPVAEKVWDIKGNIPISPTSVCGAWNFLWRVKDVLTGGTDPTYYPVALAHPWIVVLSSNGVDHAGADDYWQSASNLVGNNPGSNHSWLVLQQPITNVQLLVDCRNGTQGYGDVVVSCTGTFTGGSLTNRPTAPDETTFVNNDGFAPFNNSSATGFLHIWHDATDGSHTRIAGCRNAHTEMFAAFDAVTPQLGVIWATPVTALYLNDNNPSYTVCTFGTMQQTPNVRCTRDSWVRAMFCSCESWNNNVHPVDFSTAMTTTGTWCVAPITGLWWTDGGKLAMPASAGTSVLPDILWGCTTIVNGSGYLNPDSVPAGSRDWIQLGNLVLPWNNTVIETA